MPYACHCTSRVSLRKALSISKNKRFLAARYGCKREEMQVPRVHKRTAGTARQKGWWRQNCCTLRKRITKLKLSIRKSSQSTFSLKRDASNGSMAPCRSHHGNHTLKRNGSLKWSVGNWIPAHAIKLDVYIYIYIGYGGHRLRLKCAQVHHQSPAGTFARVPGRCLRWSPTPRDPLIPCFYKHIMLHRWSFTSVQTLHTYTLL